MSVKYLICQYKPFTQSERAENLPRQQRSTKGKKKKAEQKKNTFLILPYLIQMLSLSTMQNRRLL